MSLESDQKICLFSGTKFNRRHYCSLQSWQASQLSPRRRHSSTWINATSNDGTTSHENANDGPTRYGTSWHGSSRYGTSRNGSTWHGTSWYGATWHGTSWYVWTTWNGRANGRPAGYAHGWTPENDGAWRPPDDVWWAKIKMKSVKLF